MVSDEEIATVSALSDSDLLIEIGRSIEEREGMPAFPSRERWLRKGRTWLDEFIERAKTTICTDPGIRGHIKGRPAVMTQSIGLVALALVDAALVPPVPIATVSALIVRRGVENLCAEIWRSDMPA